jgi:AraC-like DNA-binding protein
MRHSILFTAVCDGKQDEALSVLTIDQVDREVLCKLVDNALGLAVDVGTILRELNIARTPQDLRDGQHIGFDDYLRLQRALSTATRAAIHNRVGQRALTQEEYEVLFHYMLGAEDLAGALVRMKFFTGMFGERIGNGAMHLSIDQPSVAKLYTRNDVDAELQQTFASHFLREQLKLIEVLSWFIGEPIDLIRVELPFAASAEVEQFIDRLHCPVSYGASGFGLYFSRALLHKPIVQSLQELQSFLRIFGAVFVKAEHRQRSPLGQRIERILEKNALDAGGMPSATELANALNMSEATLRRRLRETGRSFSEIKRACQMRLGKKLLVIPNRNVTDIALQLGYQDVNAFRRAFRQSLGHTPEDFRRSCQVAQTV